MNRSTTPTAAPVTDSRVSDLSAIADAVLAEARRRGASAAEAAISRAQGFSVTARMGDVESVEHHRDKSLVVSVYFGHRLGSASTSDFGGAAVRDTVEAACTIAKHTAEDPFNGLADPGRLARDIPALDLSHPWSVDVGQAIEVALACENAARETDSRIVNSEGAGVSTHQSFEWYANSNGFGGGIEATRHSISCAVVGQTASGMQRDHWYTVARDPAELDPADSVGRVCAARTLRRLDARKLKTRETPVLFEAPVARSLIGHFIAAVRGSSLYRKASFLLDQLGQPVFASHLNLREQPHLPKALGSAPFDNEGVATVERDLVSDGVLQSYVLDSYSARKLGMETTGNAGGVHNLTVLGHGADFESLLRDMDTGLLVTELIGFGVNTVTGDYSRGAAGFWIENGEVAYPVEELTIAGNLKDIFQSIAAVGTDIDLRGNIRTGSVLIGKMTVAGE